MYVPVAALGAAEAASPFDHKELAGASYRVASDQFRSIFKMALVGWKVRGTVVDKGLGHDPEPGDIETERTETAFMTPYNESTGPTDPGDGMRWVEYRRQLGRGIIILPYAGFSPDDDVLRRTTGEIQAIATEDFAFVRGIGDRGFVLYEPAQGWKNIEAPGPFPGESDSVKAAVVVAVAAVVIAAAGYYLWSR